MLPRADSELLRILPVNCVLPLMQMQMSAGYAGDVWDPQPPPEDHPWRKMPNHGMTPHYSGTTLDAQVPLLIDYLKPLITCSGAVPWRPTPMLSCYERGCVYKHAFACINV